MRKKRSSKNRVPTMADIDMFGHSVEETLRNIHVRCIPKVTKRKKTKRTTDFKDIEHEESHMHLV